MRRELVEVLVALAWAFAAGLAKGLWALAPKAGRCR